MSSSHLSHDEFFTRLSSLFDANRTSAHGSVFLTQKRLSYDQPSPAADSPLADLSPAAPLPLLVRATDGKWKGERRDRVKIATVVAPGEIEAFYARYAEVCKGGMSGLKKRDRSKRKKTKKGAAKG